MNGWVDQNTLCIIDQTLMTPFAATCDWEQKQKQLVDRFTRYDCFSCSYSSVLPHFFIQSPMPPKRKRKRKLIFFCSSRQYFIPNVYMFNNSFVDTVYVCFLSSFWVCCFLFILNCNGEMNKRKKNKVDRLNNMCDEWIGQSEKSCNYNEKYIGFSPHLSGTLEKSIIIKCAFQWWIKWIFCDWNVTGFPHWGNVFHRSARILIKSDA